MTQCVERSEVSECGCAMSTGLCRSHCRILQIGPHFFIVLAIMSISHCIYLLNGQDVDEPTAILCKPLYLEVKPKACAPKMSVIISHCTGQVNYYGCLQQTVLVKMLRFVSALNLASTLLLLLTGNMAKTMTISCNKVELFMTTAHSI